MTSSDQRQVRAYIRARLDKLGWDVKRLAEAAGVNTASLYNALSETKEKPIGYEMLAKIAKALDESPLKLFKLGGLIDASSLSEEDELWEELRAAFDSLDNNADRLAAIRLVWSLAKARREAAERSTGERDSDSQTTRRMHRPVQLAENRRKYKAEP